MPIFEFKGKTPQLAEDVYISPRASVIGAVTIGARSNVWEHTVIRGDYNTITIGSDSSIQDNCTVHADLRFPTKIGSRVILGHNSVVHGCTIEDDILVGVGAIILNGAHISDHAIIGAGSVVTPFTKIPPKTLVLGIPGKVVRTLTQGDLTELEYNWQGYVELAKQYLAQSKDKSATRSRD